MPAAMETELYKPSMNQFSSQAVIVNEPKDNSGCWNRFQAGIRGMRSYNNDFLCYSL